MLGLGRPRDSPTSVSDTRGDVTRTARRHGDPFGALVADDAGVVVSGEDVLRPAAAILDFVRLLAVTLNLGLVMAARGCVFARGCVAMAMVGASVMENTTRHRV